MFEHDEYYRSHQQLGFINPAGQVVLNRASVLVIGAGGLGSPCLLQLATAGVGNIGIVDFDAVSQSNLHRQTLYTMADLGKNKAEAAKACLLRHNPSLLVKSHQVFVDQRNVIELLDPYDVVVDCTDNFEVRFLINDACVSLKKPLVYGAIHREEGHLSVFNYQGSTNLRHLFPEINANAVQSCAEIGAYGIATTLIGTMMAGEIIKILLGLPDIFINKLVCVDVLDGRTRHMKIGVNKAAGEIINQPPEVEDPFTISPEKFFALPETAYKLIDVRTTIEREKFEIGGIHIELEELIEQREFPGLAHNDRIIVYCSQGNRSLEAIHYLRGLGFKEVYSLGGGLRASKNYL